MTYTVETTHDGRVKIDFTEPHRFTVVRQFHDGGIPLDYRLDDEQKRAVYAFVVGLSDEQLAHVAEELCKREQQLMAQIGRYDQSAGLEGLPFRVSTPHEGQRRLIGDYPKNPFCVDLRLIDDPSRPEVLFTMESRDASERAGWEWDRFVGQLGTENAAFHESKLIERALELAAEITGS